MARRELTLESLDEAIQECERLLESGYSRGGNWSLAEICCHLRVTIERNMTGYPTWMNILGMPIRPIMRRFMLPKLLRGDSPSGMPTSKIFLPPDDIEDSEEVEKFRMCVQEFLSTKTQLHPHPGFGPMTHEEFNAFHAAHSAHHLSFLHPAT